MLEAKLILSLGLQLFDFGEDFWRWLMVMVWEKGGVIFFSKIYISQSFSQIKFEFDSFNF